MPLSGRRFTFAQQDPVGSFVEAYPDLAGTFADLGFDPISAAGIPLWSLTSEPKALLVDLAIKARRHRWVEETDWSAEPISTLIQHLHDTHHAYLRSELPRLSVLVRAIASSTEDLRDLATTFAGFSTRQLQHLGIEESQLFPHCLALDHARHVDHLPDARLLYHELHDLSHDHEDAMATIDRMSERLAGNPESGDGVIRAFAEGLQELRDDLVVHFAEEEGVLLPAALHVSEVLGTRLKKGHE